PRGSLPTAKTCESANDGVLAPAAVVFTKTDTKLFAPFKLPTTRSARPSPLKSPTATDCGLVPTAKGFGAARVGVVPPAAVVFRNTDTVLSPWLTRAKSGRPSLLKSATTAASG